MHRHVKILTVACILIAIGFVAGRYIMYTDVAHYDGDHP
jgi:hypothetical protein